MQIANTVTPKVLTDIENNVWSIANGGTASSTQNFVDLSTNQTISGVKTFADDVALNADITLTGNLTAGVIGTSTTYEFKSGGSTTLINDSFIGITNVFASLYYGISSTLPSPAGTSTVGGYFNGMGIGGSSSNTGKPIFGVLNSAQTGAGLGAVALTMYDNNKLVTFNSTLDDGTGNMSLKGGLSTALSTKTAAYTLSSTDSTILVNSTSALTVTLPTAVGIAGRIYTIKNISTGVVTVATTSSQTIDGATTYSLGTQYEKITVQSDNANWWLID